MAEAVIVSSVRTAVGHAFKGTLRATRPDDLGAVAIQGALARLPQLDPREVRTIADRIGGRSVHSHADLPGHLALWQACRRASRRLRCRAAAISI